MNQKVRIEELLDNIRADCCRDGHSRKALAVLDYKMRFERAYFQEKTVDHYGKSDISWHGSMVIFYSYTDSDPEPVLQRVYFGDISFADDTQDWLAVLSMVDHLLAQVRDSLLFTKDMSLQSDNARCYMSQWFKAYIPLPAISQRVLVDRYIHTKTKDSESLLDAHFATCSKWVD